MSALAAALFTGAWLSVCLAASMAVLLAPGDARRWWPASFAARAAVLVAVALAVRIVPLIAVNAEPDAGTLYDLRSYSITAQLLRSGSDVYENTLRHPYLPMMMYPMAFADWLAERTDISFLLLVKVPGVLADAAIPLVILAWTGAAVAASRAARMAMVYALNPLTIMVVSVHGHFDSVPLLFLLLALLPLRTVPTSQPRTAALSGLAMGVAVLAKLWPAIFVPLALRQLSTWRARGAFVAAAGAVPLAALAFYGALLRVVPVEAVHRAFANSGWKGSWGYSLFAWKARNDSGVARDVFFFVEDYGNLLLAAAMALILPFAMRRSLASGAALLLLGFYTFTVGFGLHYLMWIVPFLLLGTGRWVAASYMTLASVTMLIALFGQGGVYWGLYRYTPDAFYMSWLWALSAPMWVLVAGLLVRELTLRREGLEPGRSLEAAAAPASA